MATNANFFDNVHPYDQVRALSDTLLNRARRDYLPSARTADLVREAVDVLKDLDPDLNVVHIVQPDDHIIDFPDTRGSITPTTVVSVETKPRDDGNLTYRVMLDFEGFDMRYFTSVDDVMRVLAAVAYLAKTSPDKPRTWKSLKAVVEFTGSPAPLAPWGPGDRLIKKGGEVVPFTPGDSWKGNPDAVNAILDKLKAEEEEN